MTGKSASEDEVEFVQHAPQLPSFPEWNGDTAPIDFNDWLLQLEVVMADLTPTSEEWWERCVAEARSWYAQHTRMSPLQRLTHPVTPSKELATKRWSRLEKRGASLLMAALPTQLKEEVVSSSVSTLLGS